MISFILKFQNYVLKKLGSETITISSYREINRSDLSGFNLVLLYPDKYCVKYFSDMGFEVYTDVRLSKNTLIFSEKEMLEFLLDNDKKVPDKDYLVIRVVYFS